MIELLWRRPRLVIVQNPPVVPLVIVDAFCLLVKGRFIIDSHPVSFGAKNSKVGSTFLPLTRASARRAEAVLVTVETFVDQVTTWGARGLIVHEPPPVWAGSLRAATSVRPRVVFVCTFAVDEPVAEVLRAARLMPDTDVWITGDTTVARHGVLQSVPVNVHLTGFLRGAAYISALASADVVLSLSTEATSVMRSAYEAVYATRMLVVSDTPDTRQVFPYALHTSNDSPAILHAVQQAMSLSATNKIERAERAYKHQIALWDSQARSLLEAAGISPQMKA